MRIWLLWILAPLAALALAVLWMRAPSADVQLLMEILIASEVLSLLLG